MTWVTPEKVTPALRSYPENYPATNSLRPMGTLLGNYL
jgi:hypothetical protein